MKTLWQQSELDICPHFDACGGCMSQDMTPENYRAWKEKLIFDALRGQNIFHELDDFILCDPNSRRRVTLAFNGLGQNAVLGFHAPRSHTIIPIETCIVAVPQIVEALPALKQIAGMLKAKSDSAEMHVLSTETGLDISIRNVDKPNLQLRGALTETARRLKFARLTVNDDIFAAFHAPALSFGAAKVTPPPGSFVQAVKAAETALAEFILAALKAHKIKRTADLFSGCGAFTFRIAEHCAVHAVEGHEAAIAALDEAARHTPKLKPVTIEKRDLFRRPLVPLELKSYGAIVLDPPRQGAQAQCAELASSAVPLVVYVSCNPASFARDAKTLIDSGYHLQRLIAVDQFLWSEHIEVAGVFTQKPKV